MAIEKVELMNKCSPKHLPMGTARMKYDKDEEEEGKKERVNMEKSTAGTEKMSRRPILL